MTDDLAERLEAAADLMLDTRVSYVDEITMASLLREAATRIKVQRMEVIGLVGSVDDLMVARNQLRNAVGAIIDSGSGYCEGPHDVAAAIYRLTAERDALKARLAPPDESRSAGWVQTMPDPYKAARMVRCVDGSLVHDFKGQSRCPGCGIDGITFTHRAPGVSETHTDPKEEQQ